MKAAKEKAVTLAPDRSVGIIRQPDQAHRLHEITDGAILGLSTAHGQHGRNCERPAGAPPPRQTGRFQDVARPVEERFLMVSASRVQVMVGSRTPDRAGTRTRDHHAFRSTAYFRVMLILAARLAKKHNNFKKRNIFAFPKPEAQASITALCSVQHLRWRKRKTRRARALASVPCGDANAFPLRAGAS